MMQVDYEQRIDFDRMRNHREARIQQYLDKFDISCLVCAFRDVQQAVRHLKRPWPRPRWITWPAMRSSRAAGKPHIFGFGSEVAAEKLNCPLDQGPRVSGPHSTMYGALPLDWGCYNNFIKDLDMVLEEHGIKRDDPIGVDVMESQLIVSLNEQGFRIADGQAVMQHSRSIKNEDEVACLKHAAAIADAAHHSIAQTIEPESRKPTSRPRPRQSCIVWEHNGFITSR